MNAKKTAIFITLLLFIIFLPGCAFLPGCDMQENDEEEAQQEEEEEMPEEIEEVESGALEIMQQADLVPVIDMVSEEAGEDGQEEEENENNKDNKDNEDNEENENEGENEEEDGNEEESGEEESEQQENNLEEIIIMEDVVLSEVLVKERENENENNLEEETQYPQDTREIWHNIESAILRLYEQWDRLEPQLAGENISPEDLESFEENLDSLTIASTEENYYETLTVTNELTRHLPVFMTPFSENCTPAAYELKYHTRNIVLTSAAGNYAGAQDSLSYMNQLESRLSEDLEEKDAEETAQQLKTSLSNLQRAVEKQNIDIIKVNAAVNMENIVQAIEDLE